MGILRRGLGSLPPMNHLAVDGAILSCMTKAEIIAESKKRAVGDPAATQVIWLKEIALQLAILNERNEKLDKKTK
jgi:hypothetical protein